MKKLYLIAVFVVVFFVDGVAFAAPKVATFQGKPDEVFNAAVLFTQQNWQVTSIDRPTLTMSFTTGVSLRSWGMDCGVLIEKIDEDNVRVTLNLHKKSQLYNWDAEESIARKFFDGIQGELGKMDQSRSKIPVVSSKP